MYVINAEKSMPKVYKCNGLIANWLIMQKSIPLLEREDAETWLFADTDLLREVLEDLPFYLKVGSAITNRIRKGGK